MIKGFAALGIAGALAVVAAPARADDIEAKAQGCGVCHGRDGVPAGPTIPNIWGQREDYLVKQMHDYRAGDRNSAMMAPMAKLVAQADTRPISAYFAAKPWPGKVAGSGAAPAALPAEIAEKIAEKIAMCKACHGPNFEGAPSGPRLAGLGAQYLAGTMKAFATGSRTNNNDMPGFMKALSDSERTAIAKYLSGL